MRRRTFLRLPLLAVPYLVPALVQAESQTLEQLIHRNYGKDEKLAERNNQYLIEGIRYSPKTITVARASKHARVVLEKALRKLAHCPLQKDYAGYGVSGFSFHTGITEAVQKLSIRQLVRAHLLFESLNDRAFRSQLMAEIYNDLEDPQTKEGFYSSEYGGLIKIDSGHLAIYPVPSVDATTKVLHYDNQGNSWAFDKKGTNGMYLMPTVVREREPSVFEYHFHALKPNNSHTCGPSMGIDEEGRQAADIGNVMHAMQTQGEGHELVMTKLAGDRFNVVYYTGERSFSGPHKIIILNMADWHGK